MHKVRLLVTVYPFEGIEFEASLDVVMPHIETGMRIAGIEGSGRSHLVVQLVWQPQESDVTLAFLEDDDYRGKPGVRSFRGDLLACYHAWDIDPDDEGDEDEEDEDEDEDE